MTAVIRLLQQYRHRRRKREEFKGHIGSVVTEGVGVVQIAGVIRVIAS